MIIKRKLTLNWRKDMRADLENILEDEADQEMIVWLRFPGCLEVNFYLLLRCQKDERSWDGLKVVSISHMKYCRWNDKMSPDRNVITFYPQTWVRGPGITSLQIRFSAASHVFGCHPDDNYNSQLLYINSMIPLIVKSTVESTARVNSEKTQWADDDWMSITDEWIWIEFKRLPSKSWGGELNHS